MTEFLPPLHHSGKFETSFGNTRTAGRGSIPKLDALTGVIDCRVAVDVF